MAAITICIRNFQLSFPPSVLMFFENTSENFSGKRDEGEGGQPFWVPEQLQFYRFIRKVCTLWFCIQLLYHWEKSLNFVFYPIPSSLPSLLFTPSADTLMFSRQVVSNSSWPHRLRHARLPCSSPSPEVFPSSCSLNRWCHPTVSSSVALFSCL